MIMGCLYFRNGNVESRISSDECINENVQIYQKIAKTKNLQKMLRNQQSYAKNVKTAIYDKQKEISTKTRRKEHLYATKILIQVKHQRFISDFYYVLPIRKDDGGNIALSEFSGEIGMGIQVE